MNMKNGREKKNRHIRFRKFNGTRTLIQREKGVTNLISFKTGSNLSIGNMKIGLGFLSLDMIVKNMRYILV